MGITSPRSWRPESLPNVLEHWQRVVDEPDQPQQYRLNVVHRDGTHITMEVNGLGTIVDGEFAGGHGSVRDIRERVALEEGLRKQTVELSRGMEVQRTLGEIARSIVEVDDAGETLQQVVDASKRLLGSDGAHLTLMDDDGQNLIPMVIAGDTDPETRAWLHRQRFPVGGGINGLAAAHRRAGVDGRLHGRPAPAPRPERRVAGAPAARRRGCRAAVPAPAAR